MDPTLRRLVEAGDGDDEVAVMVRLADPSALPEHGRVVARFGDVATVRAPRRSIEALRDEPDVRSVKAPRDYRPELIAVETDAEAVQVGDSDRRRPEGPAPTGRGVVVGILDWGLDFRHPAFRRPDGTTRVIALWDQSADYDPARPNRFGYGRIHTSAEIDAALVQDDPVAALGYDPSPWDTGGGTHGTATASVAAGSAWPGGVDGVAPGADIVFVNLADSGGLGHSVALGEAVEFVRATAGDRPWVVSMSLGRHGGPHDGSTLLEQMLDAAVEQAPGGMVVNSAGNYFSNDTHTTARVAPGQVLRLPFQIGDSDGGVHEIDLWYSGVDRLMVGLTAPDGQTALARPGADTTLVVDGRTVARLQHRVGDPNNGRNQALLRIQPDAPRGAWELVVVGADVLDGRFHAWIERDSPKAQARFDRDTAVSQTSTGTITNGRRNISVGAYDGHDADRPLARFSSSGDTVDGRRKPDVLAPGERVLVARSRPAGAAAEDAPLSTRMSGTSLAAPYVAGAAACVMEVLGRVPASQVRVALLETSDPFEGEDRERAGRGYVDVGAAIETVSAPPRGGRRPRRRSAEAMAPPPVQEAAVAVAAERQDMETVMTTMEQPQYTPTGPAVDGAALPQPDAVLRALGASPRALFDVFVLGRGDAERRRLAGRVDLVAGPGDPAEGLPQRGDLLLRGAMGEGHAVLSVLVDGELHDLRSLDRQGFDAEGRLPGRYAWVVEGGSLPRTRSDRFARRVTDARGFVPRDQAVLRLAPDALTASPAAPAPAPTESIGELVDSGEAVDGGTRLRTMGHQAALNRIEGAGLLVDGVGGPLTEVAVTGFQTRHGLVADGTAGEATERAFLLAEAAPRTIGGLEGRYFPPPGGKDAAPFSRASTVEAIVDGQEYFRQIKKQIDALKSGDAWYVTSWLHEPGFTFAGGGKVGALLVEKAALGVDVRVIVWANKQVLDNPKSGLFPPWVLGVCTNNVKAAEDLRSRKDPSGATPLNGRVLIDWSGNAASSHHMKLSVFSVEGRVTAFPSGLDYAQNRLDTPMHKPPSSLWHDAGNRVVGDAANAVLDTFVTRWTEASTLSAATYDIGTGKKPYNPPPLTPFSPPKPGASPAPSTDTSIQVVRSWPDSKEFGLIKNKKWATLPADGVHECKRTFQQMLGAAQRYVYIEDQGFDAVDSLFPKVVDACKRGVKVIALVPGQADPTEGGGKKPPVLSSEVVDGILKKLTKAEQMNLAVWILDGIFVHAKLVLVDDELMSIGSANFMDRSMQFTLKGDDSECTVVTVTTGSAVADLRVKLWAEHMRVSGAKPEAELRDLSKSLGFWRAAWGTGITFPVPDTPLVFVGPPTGGVGSGGGGSGGGGSSGGGSGGGSGGSGGTTTPITA